MVFQALTPPDSELIDSGWIQVMLPIRPNGSTGWIRTSDVELTNNPFRIEVDVDDFTLTVYRENAVHLVTEVGIGEGATPTPLGTFFLTDLLSPSNSSGVYGPYAYGLSGFSETLTSFNGGQGVIGIHGTNQPDALGSRVSHGCVRVANETISEMASFLPLGTPVVIDTDPQPIVNAGT
jgi:lipoprotein-anchoring transpeptidase ErfK/SrfK